MDTIYRIGNLDTIENTNPWFTACNQYNYILVNIKNKIQSLMFTDRELITAIKRAQKNPEDVSSVTQFSPFILSYTDPSGISDVSIVDNKNKHNLANESYNCIIANMNNDIVPLLFTNYELQSGIKRAQKNPEDIPNQNNNDIVYAKNFSNGFNFLDCTQCLQEAINSGAKRVVITNEGFPWISGPLYLKSNQEIYLEEGTIIEAKSNDNNKPFGLGNSFLTAWDRKNIKIIGYGAKILMKKNEYTEGQWRHALRLIGCNNTTVKGLSLCNSGGDGIYISCNRNNESNNVKIIDTICDNNKRNGITIISSKNLTIENCIVKNSNGSNPQAGIDLEPNQDKDFIHQLKNVSIKNVKIINNKNYGITMNFWKMNQNNPDLDIIFENIYVSGSSAAIQVYNNYDNGPAGQIQFKNILAEKTDIGIRIYEKSSERAKVIFENCTLEDIGQLEDYPIVIYGLSYNQDVEKPGGIEFKNCIVHDNMNRAVIGTKSGIKAGKEDLWDVTGKIYVYNNYNPYVDWNEATTHNVTLELIQK